MKSASSSSSIGTKTSSKDNNKTKDDDNDDDDEMKFLKKVHRWDKMMRNNSFTSKDTPVHREVVVKSAIKGEQLQKQAKRDSANLVEIESINSLSGI
jgi:hypothetical protein